VVGNGVVPERKREMRNILTRLWKEEDGQDLTEYALLLVLVALGAITSMSSLAADLSLAFSKAGSNLTAAT
jgi:pilus assembly protein Flp/PilA